MHNILNSIFEESGLTKAQFARDLDVSRSYIIALLEGSKTLSDSIFLKLKTLDYVSKKHIVELSEMLIKDKYSNETVELVEYFFDTAKEFSFEGKSKSIANFQISNETIHLNKRSVVGAACAVLREAIDKGQKLYTNYPFSFTALDEALYTTYKKKYNPAVTTIDHIVMFSGEVDKGSILSFWKSMRWGALRIPANAVIMQNQGVVMPYYIVTNDRVIILSSDGQNGSLITSPSLADLYISEHRALSSNSHNLFYIVEDEGQLLSRSDFIGATYLATFYSFMTPSATLDYDLLYRNTADNPHELKDVLIKAFLNYYGAVPEHKDCLCVFQNHVAEDFMKNGLIHVVSEKYLNAFSVEDRKIVLNNLSTLDNFKQLKDDSITLPEHASFEITDKFISFHFILSYPGHTDYELYATIGRDSYHGMDTFLKALEEFLRNDSLYLDDKQFKFRLQQLCLTGSLYD